MKVVIGVSIIWEVSWSYRCFLLNILEFAAQGSLQNMGRFLKCGLISYLAPSPEFDLSFIKKRWLFMNLGENLNFFMWFEQVCKKKQDGALLMASWLFVDG